MFLNFINANAKKPQTLKTAKKPCVIKAKDTVTLENIGKFHAGTPIFYK